MWLKDWPDISDAETIWLILAISAVLFLLFYPRNKK